MPEHDADGHDGSCLVAGSDDCPLCDAVARDPAIDLDSPIAVSDHFALIPALGQVVPGHALITSRVHRPSLLAAPINERLDAEKMVSEVVGLVERQSRLRCGVFEHGYDKTRRHKVAENDCSINHLHIHVLPLRESTIEELDRHVGSYETVGDSVLKLEKRDDYLLYRRHNGPWQISPPNEPIRSRHFLKIVDGLEDKADSWDEALSVDWNRIERTRALYSALSRCVVGL